MAYRRDFAGRRYDAEYTHNLRWRYRPAYGAGSSPDPYMGGGSYGRGYGRARDVPPDIGMGGGRWAGYARVWTGMERQGPPPRWRRGTEPGPRRARGPGRRRRAREAYGAAPPRRRRRYAFGPGPYAGRPRGWRGTAARDYERAYPYFGSAAAAEAAVGYPPGETLTPDAHPRGWRPDMTFYGDIY